MTPRLTKMTYRLDRCARCLADCAAVESLETDPLCTACQFELIANENFPGIRHNSLTELAIIFATLSPAPRPTCPGYFSTDDCGNRLDNGADLCSDCHWSRLMIESPRIAR